MDPPGASLGAMTGAGDQIAYFNTGFVAPRVERWQFSVQRQLAGRTALEVAYVGSKGRELETARNPSGIPLEYLSRACTRDQARIDYLGRQDLDNPSLSAAASPPLAARAAFQSRPADRLSAVHKDGDYHQRGPLLYHSLQAKLSDGFPRASRPVRRTLWSRFIEAIAFANEMDASPYRPSRVPISPSLFGKLDL
jgi:hypothetical protein